MSDSKQAPDWERQFHEAAMTYRVATIVQAPRAFEELLRLARQPAAIDKQDKQPNRDTKQLADWLLIDPQTGEPMHFAGPLERDFLRMSRVKMESKSGDVWTLTAGLKEGYLTSAERMANLEKVAAEERQAARAAQQTLSDGAQFFACYLIDNCENEVVREESVQAWLGKMLASPRYHPAAPSVEQDERANLDVWYGPMPESNGKTNWTAILHKGDLAEGHTIDRSEYPDRVRYAADCVRYLIGELKERPWILDYDADKHSGYVANVAQGAEAVVGELEAFKAWFKTSGFWNDAITEKAWRAACAWMRKSNSALCESIAQQSRNSLFRSGAKICAGNIRDGAKEPCDLPPTGWYCTRDKGHDGPCAALTAPPAQTAITDDARECLMDVVSHHHDFRTACLEIKMAVETTRSDELYWQKQIDVLDRMKAQAERALKAAQSASGEKI